MSLPPLWISAACTIVPGLPGEFAPGAFGLAEGTQTVLIPGASWSFRIFAVGETLATQISPLAVQPVVSCLLGPAAPAIVLVLRTPLLMNVIQIDAVLASDGVTPAAPGDVVIVWFTAQRRFSSTGFVFP